MMWKMIQYTYAIIIYLQRHYVCDWPQIYHVITNIFQYVKKIRWHLPRGQYLFWCLMVGGYCRA